VLLILARPLTADEVADLEAWLYGRWAGVVQAAGFGTVTREHGVDLRPVTSAADLGGYLTKVEGKGGRSWGIGQELARSDLKRGGESLVPFDLLADFVATGDVEAANLWREYEAATFGKQSVRWSPGLKDVLGVRDISDVEAAAAEDIDSAAYFRWLVDAALWRAAIKGRRIGSVLTACERDAADRFATADRLGVDLVPLADHEATDHLGGDP
jgi:hypothetical protein